MQVAPKQVNVHGGGSWLARGEPESIRQFTVDSREFRSRRGGVQRAWQGSEGEAGGAEDAEGLAILEKGDEGLAAGWAGDPEGAGAGDGLEAADDGAVGERLARILATEDL